MVAFIILLAIIIILSIILLVPSQLEYNLSFNESKKENTLILKFLFIKISLTDKDKKTKKKQKNTSDKQKKFEVSEVWDNVQKGFKLFKKFKKSFGKILIYAKNHAVTFKQITLELTFDREDPMTAGIMTGAVNAGVYNLLALLDNTVGVEKHKINITPKFKNTDYFDIRFNCIVKLKNVHIIVILFKILCLLLKIKIQSLF